MNASLDILVGRKAARTFLKSAYYTPPLKIADITENKKAGRLHLMLMSSSPGILDGDRYQLKIELEEDCSLQLHTQSYQRLFRMNRSASQSMEVHASSGASFCFLPHPVVPHAGSTFTSVNTIYLQENCSLVYGEIVTCGRKGSGETFLFSKFHSTTAIYIGKRLVVKENLLLQPAAVPLSAMGQLEGYTHQGSLVYLHPSAGIAALSAMITGQLSVQEGILCGVTQAPANGLIVRILGNKAEQLYDCFKQIAGFLPSVYSNSAYAI